MPEGSNSFLSSKFKSYIKLLAICINISLSSFYGGYARVYLGSLTIQDFNFAIIKGYQFQQQSWASQSVIQGTVPVGAIFGALCSSLVIKKFSRRNGFLVTNMIAIVSIIAMVYAKNPFIFIFMRILQGICSGIYNVIVPLYINQIVTPDLKRMGSLYQISVGFSQIFCFLLSFILNIKFQDSDDKNGSAIITWNVIALFPLILISVQSLMLLIIFPYETPKYLLEKGQIKQANNLINLIYSQQQSHQEINQSVQFSSSEQTTEQQFLDIAKSEIIEEETQKQSKNVKIAIFFAIHISLLQQMSGINAIVVYGKNIIAQAFQNDTLLVGIFTIGLFILSAAASIATLKVMNLKGRKYLIQLGTLACTICLGALSLAFFLRGDKTYSDSKPESVVIIIGMWIFMGFFGLTLGLIVWLYIPQIVEPNIIPFSTMTNLVGAAVCITLFPLIKSMKYVSFLFFFLWCLLSLLINHKIMVETRNKSRQAVLEEFSSKKLC